MDQIVPIEKISSKVRVREILGQAKQSWEQQGQDALLVTINEGLLKNKVSFPLLEFAAKEMALWIPENEQLHFMDIMVATKEMGSYVLAGMMLQLRLPLHLEQSIQRACAYILSGDQWYVCDIIGERVLGHALLTYPEKTIPLLALLAKNSDKWIVRTIGVATHYAVKKGLSPKFAETMFRLLLILSNATNLHIKKRIGWGAKTIAKFHPTIIAHYQKQIELPETRQWFRTKVNIGLNRNKIAKSV
ncbi:DNA alkylation repair protein [Sphingobacterium sp. ML3W]|uniref:DNA alkylation repair protein n=1 Tax=Sphingobacterium sp. ML3W TaxID=1538644 RepID=UPI00249C3676|nr:DNA alkylation repair protein [Sphingobacterium sp. ML3W]WFA77492.1 DNA alkylation repair protein [Sphingobacterium sp. ML3W]